MKLKIQTALIDAITFTIMVLSIQHVTLGQSQECKVLLHEISSAYTGKCKNGLAHGKGKTWGANSYEGKFRNGLPHGFGIYTWANGDKYEGNFYNGQMHGKGVFKGKINGKDSVYTGYWDKGVLHHKVLPPKYQIITARNVQRYTMTKTGSEKRLLIAFTQNGTTNNNISNLQIVCDTGTPLKLGEKYGFENVLYPVNCKITYQTPNAFRTVWYDVSFEFIINEAGEWTLKLFN
ncbi:MAG TPA: hypothetical protein ENN49_11965 [Bacteroidales bacterium]|nr:hypothetical protein [Bacteroidales bacterium]